jgi:thiamine pyrophosphokinase
MAEHDGDLVEVVVVTGGAPLDPLAVGAVPVGSYVVAADGGLDHALAAGLTPDALVGDLDSVSPGGLAWAREHAVVHPHPADKAATDTELAVALALTVGPSRLILLAGAGDRLDHTIAALGALGAPALDHLAVVEAWWGADRLHIATPGRDVTLAEPAGTTFSVLAMHGPASGVTIAAARWPLDDVELRALVGWGVSNEVLTPPVHVSVVAGVLTVIVPHSQRSGAAP